MTDVFITGAGSISAAGDSVDDSLRAIRSLKTGISPISILESRHTGHFLAGEIKKSNENLAEMAGWDFSEPTSRTALLAMIAAKEAVRNIERADLKNPRTALISGNSVGGMGNTEKFYSDFRKNNDSGHLRDVICHECGSSTEQTALLLGIDGFSTTISTACSSSLNAILLGLRLIRSGAYDRVIAGGSDGLARFTINGFNSLMIYSNEICRPFSADRKGLNLGEGAGFVVLETADAAGSRKKLARVLGGANTCDAYHQTASSPDGEGAYEAMRLAMKSAAVNSADIGFIKAHGTATPNNDLSEGKAIERLFGNEIPPVTSTKGYTGHTLGASGSIEVIFSILAAREGFIPQNLNFNSKMPELSFAPHTGVSVPATPFILANAFGFGGNNTSIVLEICT